MRTFWALSGRADDPSDDERERRDKEKREYWAKVLQEEEAYRSTHFPNP